MATLAALPRDLVAALVIVLMDACDASDDWSTVAALATACRASRAGVDAAVEARRRRGVPLVHDSRDWSVLLADLLVESLDAHGALLGAVAEFAYETAAPQWMMGYAVRTTSVPLAAAYDARERRAAAAMLLRSTATLIVHARNAPPGAIVSASGAGPAGVTSRPPGCVALAPTQSHLCYVDKVAEAAHVRARDAATPREARRGLTAALLAMAPGGRRCLARLTAARLLAAGRDAVPMLRAPSAVSFRSTRGHVTPPWLFAGRTPLAQYAPTPERPALSYADVLCRIAAWREPALSCTDPTKLVVRRRRPKKAAAATAGAKRKRASKEAPAPR